MDPVLKQSFAEHIAELRKTLIFSVLTLIAVFVVIFSFFNETVMDILLAGIRDLQIDMVYTTVGEVWTTKIKVSFIAAFIVSFPLLMFYLWRFLAPALYSHERRIFGVCFFSALALFLTGVAFGYFVVLPFAIRFFISFGEGTAVAMLTVSKYVSFLLGFVLPFGLVFMTPLAVFLLVKLGLLSPAILVKTRKYVWLLLLILAAVLTPPDIVSQLLLFVPMMILWEVGIAVAKHTKALREKA